ncbi:hypothetical protein SHJG_7818 [Streptomyces hygroscopicus subsp. jinggangensis 5008]|nr:hypothetical protein SHJG_7818 [Streptomyces hygroscopicus subsp. jinggangensis 5008]AGF67242.1 hypothetical protein SHJGH_7580 [Streptomyces hygroscopicus subsp. jinggangensis TL01]
MGCSLEGADILVRAGIDPDIVGTCAREAVHFASAALHHGLADPNGFLEAAGGDPDAAWKAWAMDSVEEPMDEEEGGEGDGYDEGGGDGDQYDEDEGDGDQYDEDSGACRVHGWASAYIGSVVPGEYTIELYDDLGLPGNATYLDALAFSLPVTAEAGSPEDRDACVIKAATEELAAYGCIPGSDFLGSDGSFSVQVKASERALEWLEDQRPVAEKLDLLLAGLHGSLADPAAVRAGRDRPGIEVIAEPRPGGRARLRKALAHRSWTGTTAICSCRRSLISSLTKF